MFAFGPYLLKQIEKRGVASAGAAVAEAVEESAASEAEGAPEVEGKQLKKKEYTEAEVKACSIEAMMNGEECEACQ